MKKWEICSLITVQKVPISSSNEKKTTILLKERNWSRKRQEKEKEKKKLRGIETERKKKKVRS